MLLLHHCCLLDRVDHVRVDTLELYHAGLFLILLLVHVGLVLQLLNRLLLALFSLHLLLFFVLLGQAVLLGEEGHHWLEDQHRERVHVQALVGPLWKLLEFFADGWLSVGGLLGWVVFFYVSYDALLGLFGGLLLSFLESTEK